MIPEHLTEVKIKEHHDERVAAELEAAGFDPEDKDKLWTIPGAMKRVSAGIHDDWLAHVSFRDGTAQREQRRKAKLKGVTEDDGRHDSEDDGEAVDADN